MSDKKISGLATTHFNLQSVATELASWRKNKKFSSEPIPKFIKEQIYHLVNSNQDKIIQIAKILRISKNHIKAIENSIKADFTKNEQNLSSKSSLAKPPNLDPELLPFELLPKKNITSDAKQSGINCQSNIEVNNNSPTSSDRNIVINKGSGDNLHLPTNLSEDLIYKIVQLFLCSK